MRLIAPVFFATSVALNAVSATAFSAQNKIDYQPAPKIDERGFVDVWQLRKEVVAIEPFVTSNDTDGCYREGDPEESYSEKELRRQALLEQACVEKITEEYAAYERIRSLFNKAWLPVMMDAISKGDRVAEVILRQCETTPLFDRGQIESTCDDSPRREVALDRLQEIGFVPAMGLDRRMVPLYPTRSRDEFNERKLNQNIVSRGFRHGVLGLDRSLAEAATDAEQQRRSALFVAVAQDAPRAFTFSPQSRRAGWATSELASLSLNRRPLTPGYLTRGRALHYAGGNSIWTPVHWRADRPELSELSETLAVIESNIDQYLKDDPRWAVFLIHRVGHHEWVPEGMESKTGRLNPAWEGVWKLEKETSDWTTPMKPAMGGAIIRREGGVTKMTVKTKVTTETLPDVEDCVLRYSGGLTYLPRGQKPTETLLGYFPPGNFEEGANREAIAPFDPKKRYRQVLMQCQGGEWMDNDRMRFLLLADDVLVEIGSSVLSQHAWLARLREVGRRPEGFTVRHFRRVTTASSDELHRFPFFATSNDYDDDGIPDAAEADDDNDGVPDINDIEPHNRPPRAALLNVRAYPGGHVRGVLRAVDSEQDQVTFEILSPPKQGTVELTDPDTGAFAYTARPDARGADHFTFRAHDKGGASTPQSVYLRLYRSGSVVVAGAEFPVTGYAGNLSNMVDVATGQDHIVGLKADGTVVATGPDQYRVGDWKDIVDVAAGIWHTVGLKDDGTVVATGTDNQFQLHVGDWRDVVAVEAGGFITAGLKADGTVLLTARHSEVEQWKGIVATAVGKSHIAGLKADGTVVMAGDDGTQRDVNTWKNITALAAGYSFTIGLVSDGTVVAVGEDVDGQLAVSGWKDIVAVAAGYSQSFGLKADGTVVQTGARNSEVRQWKDIAAIAAASYHLIGIKQEVPPLSHTGTPVSDAPHDR